MRDDPLEQIAADALRIIAEDVGAMRAKTLTGPQANRLVQYLRVLVPMARERREGGKELEQELQSMTHEELLAAAQSLAESEKKRGPRGK